MTPSPMMPTFFARIVMNGLHRPLEGIVPQVPGPGGVVVGRAPGSKQGHPFIDQKVTPCFEFEWPAQKGVGAACSAEGHPRRFRACSWRQNVDCRLDSLRVGPGFVGLAQVCAGEGVACCDQFRVQFYARRRQDRLLYLSGVLRAGRCTLKRDLIPQWLPSRALPAKHHMVRPPTPQNLSSA